MATTNTTTQAVGVKGVDVSASTDEAAAKAVHKRYEGLVMVRTKAACVFVQGRGHRVGGQSVPKKGL
ncbi:hypothetical protein C1H46_036171 [Malus baccata]|uniref:Uncharacterized protein n=1 Tax=Malus baccata TaxID=106549 RepID=A0A540KVM3_MALBA|nr:hypothetical protein C1H46_036171 [Malus baccata]